LEDFYSYIKNANLNTNKKQEEILKNASKETVQNIEKTVQDVAKKYENYSKDDLKEEILKQADKGKQDGNFDFGELEKIAKNITPFMNQTQQQRLNEILNLIKK